MRNLILLFLALTIFSCQSSKSEEKDDLVYERYMGPPKPFFDFDKVEYFYTDIDTNIVRELYKNESDSAKNFLEIYERWYPTDMKETSKFREELLKYGYSKYHIEDSLQAIVSTIFSSKECNEGEAAACTPEYRDIFIFYKANEIIGIGKVCFGCNQSHIIGANENVYGFGDCGDFEKLKKLVRNQKNLNS